MKCAKVKKQLSAYRDERLDAELREAVEVHLQGCDACREELRLLSAAGQVLRREGAVEPPAGLAERITRQVVAAGREPERRGILGLDGFLDRLRWPALGTAAATAALAVGLMVAAPDPGAVQRVQEQDAVAALVGLDEGDVDPLRIAGDVLAAEEEGK